MPGLRLHEDAQAQVADGGEEADRQAEGTWPPRRAGHQSHRGHNGGDAEESDDQEVDPRGPVERVADGAIRRLHGSHPRRR